MCKVERIIGRMDIGFDGKSHSNGVNNSLSITIVMPESSETAPQPIEARILRALWND